MFAAVSSHVLADPLCRTACSLRRKVHSQYRTRSVTVAQRLINVPVLCLDVGVGGGPAILLVHGVSELPAKAQHLTTIFIPADHVPVVISSPHIWVKSRDDLCLVPDEPACRLLSQASHRRFVPNGPARS